MPRRLSLRALTEQALLSELAASGVLVNTQGDILYLHGRTGQYLEPAQGEAGISNVLKMAREGLGRELATALHKAVATHARVYSPSLRVKTNGSFTMVDLSVCPVPAGSAATPDEPLFRVVLASALQPAPPPRLALPEASAASEQPVESSQSPINALMQELKAKEDYLQAATEELKTSNEELRSSNEEMQSINEELQSTNEELETSKEELQSVNEELATVNAELQTKVADLSRANNDMNNLLAGTGIATVFVDLRLRILRFTPTATRLINLIAADVGRPVAHIVSNLAGYDRLVPDAQAVLDTLIPHEVEVQTHEGRWYTMRIQPYRTLENVIEGVVITFVGISELKKLEEALLASEGRARRLAAALEASGLPPPADAEAGASELDGGAVVK